jgi:hypothetical protein
MTSTEKKFPTSFQSKVVGPQSAILFSLLNPKKPSGKAYATFEKYKTSVTIEEAVKQGFTPTDRDYETATNGRGFKKYGVITFIEGYNIKKDKEKLLYIIKQNRELLKDLPKVIQDKLTINLNHFAKLAAEIK